MTVAAFVSRAVDADTGYRPSTGLVGKILGGGKFTITPELIGAVAAGLNLPREIVAAAAHLQVIGYEETELKGGAPAMLIRRLDAEPGEPERGTAERWAAETGR
ncbi:hypothetical protein IMX12_13135 [Streptomyces sp. Babs14]|nr:hypothetical protein [Streptomyces sp. Osf17]MBU8556536.1 hypothetical protein [Streptomyces sp. Babs14]